MTKTKKLVVYGIGETAEIVADYFSHDSAYEVVAFTVDRAHQDKATLLGVPVVPLDEVVARFPPQGHEMFAAASFGKLNRGRTAMYGRAKALGYTCASYVSSRAFKWHNVSLGENVFVFENNVLQYKVRIGDNVILWSGNHVGHQTVIEDHCFVSSHVVISGFCTIGASSFLGVNTSFNDGVKLGRDCVTGNGTVVIRDTEPGGVFVGNPAKKIKSSYEAFQIEP